MEKDINNLRLEYQLNGNHLASGMSLFQLCKIIVQFSLRGAHIIFEWFVVISETFFFLFVPRVRERVSKLKFSESAMEQTLPNGKEMRRRFYTYAFFYVCVCDNGSI